MTAEHASTRCGRVCPMLTAVSGALQAMLIVIIVLILILIEMINNKISIWLKVSNQHFLLLAARVFRSTFPTVHRLVDAHSVSMQAPRSHRPPQLAELAVVVAVEMVVLTVAQWEEATLEMAALVATAARVATALMKALTPVMVEEVAVAGAAGAPMEVTTLAMAVVVAPAAKAATPH